MSSSICSMLHTELARSSPGSIDHLRIVCVTLCIDLVAQVFLVYVLIRIPLASDRVHHIRSSTDVRPIAAFEWFKMRRLSGSDDSLLWIRWTNIVVLVTFCAVYPIYRRLLLIAQSNVLRGSIWYLLCHLAAVLYYLRWPQTIIDDFLPRVVKRYLNPPVSISYIRYE